MSEMVFRALFPFCGIGGGAMGFNEAKTTLFGMNARFENVGGIDIDNAACKDFTYLTKAPALCADIAQLTTADLAAFAGETAPDVVFLSAPCKGSSKLISDAKAKEKKYEDLNLLSEKWIALMLATWKIPPKLVLFENVPNIVTRAKAMLKRVKKLLRAAGYVFHDGFHECGELGGLAQKRKRWLMVARHAPQVAPLLYQPPKLRIRGCGEVIGPLPMPGDPAGGPMHLLPKISWLNWVRLALIPAGGDWRDLPGVLAQGQQRRKLFKRHEVGAWTRPTGTIGGSGSNGVENVADPRVQIHFPLVGPAVADRRGERFSNINRVTAWDQPTPTVCGRSEPASGGPAIADVRAFPQGYGVGAWSDPSPTVTGEASVSNGASIADPRASEAEARRLWEEEGIKTPGGLHWFKGKYGVTAWTDPARAVIGGSSNGACAVADPRSPFALTPNPDRHNAKYAVGDWKKPAKSVTGATRPGSGSLAVNDPRITEPSQLRFGNVDRVTPWTEPVGTVTHAPAPSSGGGAIADVRVDGIPRSFKDGYGVLDWEGPSGTVTGSAAPTRGRFSVPDPRSEKWFNGFLRVTPWTEPARTVTGKPASGIVADPRSDLKSAFKNVLRVAPWQNPIGTVTGALSPSNGAACIADVRTPIIPESPPFDAAYGVLAWDAPSRTVAGGTQVGQGAYAIADERDVPIACEPRAGAYGVLSWEEASKTITAHAEMDNGPFAIADMRIPDVPPICIVRDVRKAPEGGVPVILAEDGTWLRPLTTLELGILQDLPPIVDGKPLCLSGTNSTLWRERIGNMVPRGAARSIANRMLMNLLGASLGAFALSADGSVWVAPKRTRGRVRDDQRVRISRRAARAMERAALLGARAGA